MQQNDIRCICNNVNFNFLRTRNYRALVCGTALDVTMKSTFMFISALHTGTVLWFFIELFAITPLPPHISDHFTSLGNYRICHYVLLAVSSAAAAQRIPLTRHKGPLEASLDGPGGFDFTFLMVCHCFTTCSMACKWLIVGRRAARKAAIADVISVTNNPLFLILIGTFTFIEYEHALLI